MDILGRASPENVFEHVADIGRAANIVVVDGLQHGLGRIHFRVDLLTGVAGAEVALVFEAFDYRSDSKVAGPRVLNGVDEQARVIAELRAGVHAVFLAEKCVIFEPFPAIDFFWPGIVDNEIDPLLFRISFAEETFEIAERGILVDVSPARLNGPPVVEL